MKLNPNFSLTQAFYGLTLAYCGRWQEGELAAGRALRLSPRGPLSAPYYGIAAFTQFIGQHYDQAIQYARESLRHRGDFVGGHRVLTAAAAMAGQDELARVALQGLLRVQPDISLHWIARELAKSLRKGSKSREQELIQPLLKTPTQTRMFQEQHRSNQAYAE